uniref:Uncharacterized protein n=1 Tax=Oryza sativa subsp. japonica TaxID=39947 RepID=Q6EUA6_ORYSJ|nr:unknown protein [Oryza sativa Japonica Group]
MGCLGTCRGATSPCTSASAGDATSCRWRALRRQSSRSFSGRPRRSLASTTTWVSPCPAMRPPSTASSPPPLPPPSDEMRQARLHCDLLHCLLG